MKKRLLALILTLVMVVSILPGSVLADGTPVPIADPQVGNNVTASSNGITVNKYLSTDGHGNYFLTMEAYASNKVSTTTETTPLDIVLVLDVSGSMDDNINRNDEKKLTALKNAVNSFIDSVTESAVETEANHQIGIVTFADNAQTEAGLTPVQNGGADTLKTEFSNLHADGATRADRGMEAAKEVLYHSQRNAKKVVIMFTDGEPNSFSGYDADVAHDAVNAAKDMKDAGATVYTIGIFSGANPSDTNGQANKYMNAMSSNYPLAVSTSEWKDGLLGGYLEYSITLNERAQGNYYFASSSAEGLNDVFQNIANSETSSTLKVNPDETAVLSDTLSQYFNFPEGLAESSGEITVKQVPASGKVGDHFTWNDGGATDITSSVRVNVEGDQLTVTGFDYKENAVTEKTENGGAAVYTGSKLVVTFPIEVDMNACLADPIDSQYYPTNSTASGSRAGLSYKGENSGSNDTSTKLSRSPEVLLEDLDANGTDVTVEVFVDGNKVSNPLDYVTIERHGADSTYYYFKQVDLVDGKLTYDFNYNPDNGHDCVDLKLGIVNNAYVLQGVHSHQSYGNSGTENVKQEGPSYKIDNVTANNEGKVDCTIYLRSKYSVEYYQGNEKLSGSAYTDSNVYIEKADVDSTTAQDSYPTSGTPAWMDWRNTNCNTSIDLPALPDAETGYTSDGWFLGSAEGTKYEPDTSSDPVAMAQAAACAEQNVIKFYSTATQNEYTVTYAPGGHGTLDGANDEGNVVHTGLTYGATTPPAPEVTPDGTYYFTGWDPEVATTVTENVTYTAQYAARTEITVKANSATHTYDGTEKTVSGFETLTFEMPNGVKYTVEGLSASASGTDAGTYPVEVTGKAVVKDAQGHDVTSQFIVKTQNGELEITKRNVTLTSATAQKEYDGKALTNDTVTVGGDGFATGEGATYTVTGSQTVKGSSANTFTYELNSNTKADNYTITKIEGTLTVIDRESKYEITVVSKSGTAKYSGSAQTVTGFETLTFEVEGQTYTVTGLTASGSGTNVGSYPNVISGTAVVLDANRNDVTGQFTVKKQQGTLEIIKRNVTLTSASDSKEYDGKALTNSNVTVSGEGFVTGEGATYNVTGSQTLVGTSQNAFTYELNEGTLADNYNITKAEGQLNVTDRDAKFAITLEANSASIMYDGEPHEVSGFKTTTFTFDGVIFKVENITAEANGTDANEYTTRTDGTAVVKDAAGNDVTSQFAVTVTPGKLTITKRNVTLTSATDTKMYDGTALTNDEVTVSGDGFVEGEGATYNVTGSQTLVGESRNAFTYVLNAGTKADNYNITTNFGTLTITDRPDSEKYEITVKANSGTFTYDGTEKTVSGFETLTFTVNGQTYTVSGLNASASATSLGTYEVAVTGTAVVKDAGQNDVTRQFTVKTEKGTLKIQGQLIYDGNAQQGGTVTNVPTDTNQYEANNEVKLSSQIPSHSNVMDKAVCLIGWSLTKSDKIYSAGEQYPNVIETVKFDKTSITVYAVWGYDTNGDEIPDATQVMVEPVDITVYVGGNGGYEGVVNGSGTITGSNSLPEPGFYFTLPYDMNKAISEAAGKDPTDAVDLTNYLKLTGTGTEGTGRHWTIQLYDPDGNSTAYGKYVYSFVVPTGQDPVRMEFTDEAGNTKISDEFNIVDALYQEYVMAIYKGNVEGTSVKAEATINGVKMEAPVGQTTGTLTIRGVTGEEVTTSVGASVTAEPENITAVYGSNKPTYYINGSQIEVTNQDAVKLLVDEIVNADGIHETLLDMADVELTEDMDYEFKYLDLVDTSNGNVWVTMGEHDSLTVYWPYPDGTNANDDFTIVHYKGLDRDFDVSDLEEQDYTLEVFSTENGKLECTSYGIKFNVSSFSPFVLIWNDDDNNWPPIIIPEVPEDNTPNWLNLDDHYAYIVGYNDGMVKPGNNITRAEVATIFFRLLTDEAREYFWSTDSGFSDVKSGDWYNNAVSTMVNAGIITGYSDGTFKPNANITRAEFATIAARFLSNPYSLKDRFYDTEGHWAEVYINRAAEIGWIGGYPDGSFKPDRYITRAEAVTLVNNVLGREPHEDYLLEDMIRWPDNPKTAWFYEDVQEATNSHDYRWSSSKSYEIWTELLKNRDWSKLEKEWANAYSAPGGSVIG